MTGSRERRGATWPRVSTLIGHGGARRHTSLSTYGSFVSFPFWLVSFCRSLKGSQKRVIVMTVMRYDCNASPGGPALECISRSARRDGSAKESRILAHISSELDISNSQKGYVLQRESAQRSVHQVPWQLIVFHENV